jgi:DNA-binding NarL/FixJ family response regulator
MINIPSQFTSREQEVYDLTITGKSNKEIAAHLGITTRTVRFHLSNIFSKRSVSSRLELICVVANLVSSSASTR